MGDLTNRYESTYRIIFVGSCILAVLGVTLPLVAGQTNLATLGSYLAIPMILAPILYWRQKDNKSYLYEIDSRYYNLFPAIYFVLLTISVILLYTNPVRPYSYYGVITLMATVILAQILFFPSRGNRSMLIILQSSLLLLDLIWGVNLNYFFSIERTDSFFHSWMVQILVEEGTINEYFDLYRAFPLWHILCASIYKLAAMDIPFYRAMYLVNGVIFAAIPPGIYVLAKRLFSEEKIALLAALFVSFYPDVLKYGVAAIARSPVLFLGILLIGALLYHRNSAATLIVIAMTFSIIVFHTVSIPFLIVMTVVIYFLQRIYGAVKEQEIVDKDYVFFATAAMLTYWMYPSLDLFEEIIRNLTIPVHDEVRSSGVFLAPVNELFNYLQYSPLLFFLLIGALEAFKKEETSKAAKIMCLAGLLFTAVSFPGPSLLVSSLGGMNIDRFGQYVFFLIVLGVSLGFYTIYTRSQRPLKSIMIVLFMLLVFLSISNDFTASDNPLVKRPFYTFYFTEDEMDGFNYAANTSRGLIMADFITFRYMENTDHREKIHILEVDPKRSEFFKSGPSDIILIRKGELEGRPLRFYTADDGFIKKPDVDWALEYYDSDNEKLWSSLEGYSQIYDSTGISIYT